MSLHPSLQKHRSSPSAIIVGAGLGGLAAGIHLARHGWQVTIFEKNRHAGGRMNVLEEAGFRIDMGPTMLMMPEVLHEIFSIGDRDPHDYLPLTKLCPAYRILWPDGTTLDMGVEMNCLVEQVRRIQAADAARVPALLAAMKAKYENARYRFIERSFNSPLDLLHPTTLVGLLKALPLESVYQMVSRYLANEKLRQAFSFQTLYLGISPYRCPSIYALLPYVEMEFGVWFPIGGTYTLARGLERLFIELGGQIRYCLPVDQIAIQDRAAKGVRTADGCEHLADIVVCNLDLPTAYQKLIPNALRRKYSDGALAQKDYGCSGFLLYLGVKGLSLTHLPHNSIVLSENYNEVLDQIFIQRALPTDPAMHLCVPTHTDPSLAPPNHHVLYILVPCPNTQSNICWETAAPILRDRTIGKLERLGLIPNLHQHIVFERWFTPVDFEKLYGCYAGAAYGGLTPTFFQSAYFRPHSRSEEIENLYFVGASTHPGGGVPIVLTSGKLTAELIRKDYYRQIFRTN